MSTEKRKFISAGEGANAVWSELGPSILFVVVYNILIRAPEGGGLFAQEKALYWATGLLIAVTFGIITTKKLRGNKIPPFLLISSSALGIFGMIGIIWQSKTLLFVLPTIVNCLYASLIFGGLMVKRNIWKMLFGTLLDIPDHVWRTLAIRWGCFFIVLAVWNEFLWRTYSEAVWANWKLGNIFIVAAFGLAQLPLTLKYWGKPDEDNTVG